MKEDEDVHKKLIKKAKFCAFWERPESLDSHRVFEGNNHDNDKFKKLWTLTKSITDFLNLLLE